MFRTLVALLTLSLAGCATHLVPMSETKGVPKSRITAIESTQPSQGAQKITVVRNAGALFAAGVTVELSVDGRPTASIATSESLELYLDPGEHLLRAKVGGLGQVFAATTVTVPSRFPIYRIDMTDGDIKLQPSIE
ncbi:hypothetical protein [Burkholderia sp. Ac-20365]|uniref:hypothetical protein n=1 Tax=Burkholderia sp. Ac-20365 TaxID=2703897 RepID=UPI00197B36B8|nr:hypothetical protein [Burkholderia sp. Ac-20365]MBN3761146.1 hypothetical protein [Burkholderia sp. Ac-20365]